MATAALLAAEAIGKSFGRVRVLDGVCLSLRAGEVVALTGANGAGKSTLVRICAGILRPDEGRLVVTGGVGYCPQLPGLFDLLTADEHLIMFGRGAGLSRTQAIERGHALLAEFDFPVRRATLSADMSGGTRQKLNLVLALLADPAVLLLDEPYQGFDRGTYVNFWDHCSRWRAAGKGVLVVTHVLAELDRADRIVELTRDEETAG